MICLVKFHQANTEEILGYIEGNDTVDIGTVSKKLVESYLHQKNIGSTPTWSMAKCGCQWSCHVPGWGTYHIFEIQKLL